MRSLLSILFGRLPAGGRVRFVRVKRGGNAPGYWEARRRDGRWLTCGTSVFDCRRRALVILSDYAPVRA